MVEEKPDDLYGDFSEAVDNAVIQSYGKMKEDNDEPEVCLANETSLVVEEELDTEEVKEEIVQFHEERDVLDLHATEAELKAADLDKSDVLLQLPEKSKWEVRGISLLFCTK